MKRAILVLLVTIAGCPPPPPPPPPTVPLQHCEPNVDVCDAPKQCRDTDGIFLCVHVCTLGDKVCKPDEFALVKPGSTPTCACVLQRPGGRSCTDDTECIWGPDENMATKAEHLCVSVSGGARTCQPLGIACKTAGDCLSGFVCDATTRQCAVPTEPPPPPPPPQLAYRRDADGDQLCTSETRVEPAPGPGPGWRTDCTAEERAECDDYKAFTCAPTDVDFFGHAERVGTVHFPQVNLVDDAGARYDLVGAAVNDLARHEGGVRLRVAARAAGPGLLPRLTVTGFWIVGLPGGAVPRTGRVWREGGVWFFEDASGRFRVDTRRLTDADDGWKIWSVGRMEGDVYRISRHARLYKPDAP